MDFPAVAEEEYLTRQEQIGAKKRKKEEYKDTRGGNKRGRGRGGRGRGGGKIMKRPSAKEPEAGDDQENEEEEEEEADQTMEAEGVGSAPSSAPASDIAKAAQLEGDAEPEARPQGGVKARAKGWPKGKAKAKASVRTDAPPNPDWPWYAGVREKILEVLKECQASGELNQKVKHTHRCVDPVDDNQQFSIYWSRGAVGVKVRGGPSEKWCQVAYFARHTPCCLTNTLIAAEWVCV